MVEIVQQIEIGDLILVIVTGIYVYLIYKLMKQGQTQTQLLLKQGRRERIVDLIRTIITPFIDKLESNESAFRKRDFRWYKSPEGDIIVHPEKFYISHGFGLEVAGHREKIVLNKFFKTHSNIKRSVLLYNRRMSSFKKRLKSLIEKIYSSDFEKMCNKLATKGNLSGYSFQYTVGWVLDKLILDKDEMRNKYIGWHSKDVMDFHEKYESELLNKVKGKKPITKGVKHILSTSEKLEATSRDLKNKLIELRENYGEEYSIPEREYREVQ